MQTRQIVTSREIGAAIRKRRKELGMSQERLAEILDVSYQQVQRYENGTHKLNVEKIQLVADALSVPITCFFKSGYEERVAEAATAYVDAEERTLLRHFRKIEEKSARLLVIHVARLAAAKRGGGWFQKNR